MNLPMIGVLAVRVHQVKPYEIHGDRYYQLIVTLDGALENDLASTDAAAIPVPQHAVAGEPKVGDRLNVTFLMGQVTGVKRM